LELSLEWEVAVGRIKRSQGLRRKEKRCFGDAGKMARGVSRAVSSTYIRTGGGVKKKAVSSRKENVNGRKGPNGGRREGRARSKKGYFRGGPMKRLDKLSSRKRQDANQGRRGGTSRRTRAGARKKFPYHFSR